MTQWRNHITKIWLSGLTVISVVSGVLFIFLNMKVGKPALIDSASKLDLYLLLIFAGINIGFWVGFLLFRRSASLKKWFTQVFIQQKGILVLMVFVCEIFLASATALVWSGMAGHSGTLLKILPALIWVILGTLISLIIVFYFSILNKRTLFEKFQIKIVDMLVVASVVLYSIVFGNLFKKSLSANLIAILIKDANAALKYSAIFEKVSFGLIVIIFINLIILVIWFMRWVKYWQEKAEGRIEKQKEKKENRNQGIKIAGNKISGIWRKLEEINQFIDKLPQAVTKIFSQKNGRFCFGVGLGFLI